MKITEKENNSYRVKTDNPNTSIAMDISNAIQKLGQLEDIEDELGIDLITLFKALKNGFWFKKDKEIYHSHCVSMLLFANKYVFRFYCDTFIDKNDLPVDFYETIKDYGKTWSLDKKELEK